MAYEGKVKEYIKKLNEDEDIRSESSRILRDVLNLVESTSSFSSNKHLNKIVSTTGFAVSAFSVAKGVYGFYKRNKSCKNYVIKISESDDVFDIAEQWLFDAMPEEKQLSVFASSVINKTPGRRRRGDVDPMAQWEEELLESTGESVIRKKDKVEIAVSFDGAVAQVVEVDGHEVEIFTQHPERPMGGEQNRMSQNYSSRSINFVCPSLEARNAVLNELEKRSQVLDTERPSFYMSTKWGGFRRNSMIQARLSDSVFLKDGQMERILGGLEKFLANEAAYVKAGLPYRTGLLLHGNPGSGKTSTATVIANELGLNVYFISLSSMEDDDTFASCLSEVPSRSIVILEDIDVAKAVKKRGKNQEDASVGVTMTGMLNALDGLVSAYGIITIMTTNHKDVLDPAIVRPGRADIVECLSDIDDFQFRNICKYFLGELPENLPEVTEDMGISSADVVGVFKNHVPDFTKAKQDLLDFVGERVVNFTK